VFDFNTQDKLYEDLSVIAKANADAKKLADAQAALQQVPVTPRVIASNESPVAETAKQGKAVAKPVKAVAKPVKAIETPALAKKKTKASK
jgi:hypothetical protein